MSEPIQAFNDAKWLFHFSRGAIEQILDFVKPDRDAQIMIFGPAGSGKTTVMSEALGVSLKEIVPTLSVETFKAKDGLMIVDTPGDVDSIRDIITFLQKINEGKKILLIFVGAGGFRLQKQQEEAETTLSTMVSQASGEPPYRDAGVNREYFERQMEKELEHFRAVFELGIMDHEMVSGLIVIANKRDYWEANFGSSYFDENYGPGSEIYKCATKYIPSLRYRYHASAAGWDSFYIEPNICSKPIRVTERAGEIDAIRRSVIDLIPQ